MRNIRSAVIIPTLLLLGAFLTVYKSQAALVATVNIYNATVVSQENNKLKLSFDIFNRENIQPGIRYAVELNRKDGEDAVTLIDRKAYPEVLTLGPGETVHKEISYEIPDYLKGDFEVWVVSDSENGMPLGQGFAGDVKFDGSGSNVEIIFDSCNMRVAGEDKTYDLFYGVDVAASENLVLSCKVKNNFSSETSLAPSFSTYYRNVYGDLISSDEQDPFKLGAGEEKMIEFTIPKAMNPQAYDTTLVLLGQGGKEVSNKITAHYVLQGQSASIQNVRFDKNAYSRGETAKVSFQWTGSADEFRGSRKNAASGGSEANNTLEMIVKDRNSGACADTYQKELDETMPKNVNLDLDIKKDCPEPTAYLAIKDAKGNILDSKEYKLTIQSSPAVEDKSIIEDYGSPSSMKKMLFGLVAFLTILSLILIFRSKMRNRGGISSVILLLILGAFFFLATGQAEADTFTVDGKSKECEAKYKGDWSDAQYSVSTNKDSYSYGDTMRISTRIQEMSECGNGDEKGRVRGKFDKDWDENAGKSQEWYREGDTELINVKNSGSKNKNKDFIVKRNPDGEPGGAPGQHFIDLVGGVYNPSGFNKQEKDLKTRCEAFVNGLRDANKIKYNVLQPRHTVNVGINGSGWVDGSGINCGSGRPTCSVSINEGSTFTLYAHANADADFGSWGGVCSGTGTSCTRTMGTSDVSAAANFTPKDNLAIYFSGSGFGRVTSSPSGIDCYHTAGGNTGTCNNLFTRGIYVSLSYFPDPANSYCNNPTCDGPGSVYINPGANATANFTLKPKINVTISGCGTIAAPGWNCPSPGGTKTCNNPPLYVNPNTSVALTTSACADSHFGSWGGACSGTGSCSVNVGTTDQSVIAYFASQSNCSCDTNDCKNTCLGQSCKDSCGNPTCKGTLSCPLWQEVQP